MIDSIDSIDNLAETIDNLAKTNGSWIDDEVSELINNEEYENHIRNFIDYNDYSIENISITLYRTIKNNINKAKENKDISNNPAKEKKFTRFCKAAQKQMQQKIQPISLLYNALGNLKGQMEGPYSNYWIAQALNRIKAQCSVIEKNPNFNHLQKLINDVKTLCNKVAETFNISSDGNKWISTSNDQIYEHKQVPQEQVDPLIKKLDEIAEELEPSISIDKYKDVLKKTLEESGLLDIFSCDDFITVYSSEDDNQSKTNLATLLNKYKDCDYETIKQAVEESSLSSENKKIVFAGVLPQYNFKVCNEFASTWDMFEHGDIDFDTLLTKFWNRDDFEQQKSQKLIDEGKQKIANQPVKQSPNPAININNHNINENGNNIQNSQQQADPPVKADQPVKQSPGTAININNHNINENGNNIQNSQQQNAFQNFAIAYNKYIDRSGHDLDILKDSAKNMIGALGNKGAIEQQEVPILKNQIDNAADVGIVGIILQFLSNFFSGKTAFKSIQQTKQDRVISNLKPLSGLLRQAAERQKNIQQQAAERQENIQQNEIK